MEGEMTGVGSLDRTTRRIAATGSLVAGALVVYWVVEILRGQVPDVGAHDIRVTIAYLSMLALFFGLAAKRGDGGSTSGPFLFAPLSAVWASRFVLKWAKYDFGLRGIMTFAITVGLVGVAMVVRKSWRQSAAQPAVAANDASPDR
jgi:hypothetical protein